MASTKKIKVGPVHTTLYANLRLLMSCNSHSNVLQDLLSEDVFVLPNSNKKASNEVIYFLLNIWNKAKCAEKFKFCWPVLDRKQESQFQRAACTIMQEIKSMHPEACLPTISLALLLQPGGDKYCNFFLRLTTFLLKNSLKIDDLKNRPKSKKKDSEVESDVDLKREIYILIEKAAEDHGNAAATLHGADTFCKKLKDWWQTWEECEETALLKFKNEVNLLNTAQELKERLASSPANMKEFQGVVLKLKNEIDVMLTRLEGSLNPPHQRVSSVSPERKANTSQDYDLGGVSALARKLSQGINELNLLFELAEKQPGWSLNQDVARFRSLLTSGTPSDTINQLEAKLKSANRNCSQVERRHSIAPSPALQFDSFKLRQLPVTPFLMPSGVKGSPFQPNFHTVEEEEESIEDLLSRWWQMPNKMKPVPHAASQSPTLSLLAKPQPAQIKIQPVSPIQKFPQADSKCHPPVQLNSTKLTLTPPSVAEPTSQIRGRKSFFELSGDDLPLGEVSLLELAELHFSLDSGPSSPDPIVPQVPSPPQIKEVQEETPPEPEDVKPDLQSLLQRLKAVKERSRALPSVLVKNELISP
ncbi:uncharacterized protein LOC132204405 [Neocloeon triangulifer]|uniref:uncharacterized protein LOC132204405 n=1 Tax=Neocloeon triangulifer TaxID=2078957 RepID=UPI00286F80C6|nr:uncharacterized protein LOC132204405 [Neocloeon triangulifer]